jgi:hypothetical protein
VHLQRNLDALSEALDAVGDEVSPEMVLAMARERLNSLSDDIRGAMADLRMATSRSNTIRSVIDEMQAHLGSFTTPQDGDPILNLNDVDPTTGHTYRELLESAGVTDSEISAQTASGPHIDRQQSDHFLELLRNHLSDLNDGAEQRSMALQQAVSRRAEVSQLASNLLESMHDTAKAIIQNTR